MKKTEMFWRAGTGRNGKLFLVLLAASFLIGCASTMSVSIQPPFAVGKDSTEEEKKHVAEVLRTVEERNRLVEKDPEWIKTSYQDFMIKNLSEIDENDFAKYSRYLDGGYIYLVVHPAYYAFFQDSDIVPDNNSRMSPQNAMERFLGESAFSSKTRLIKAQEKMLRDFLEYATTEKKLIVLVLPRGYRTYAGYKYREADDEFMRYINEVTNGSDSVLYLYSKKPNRGTLTDRDRKKLLKFLYSVKAESVLLGGGYIGRCLEDFYKDIDQYFSEDKLYLVPEISSISPSDMTTGFASDMLQADGTIDIVKLSENIQANALGNQDISPKMRSLSRAPIKNTD